MKIKALFFGMAVIAFLTVSSCGSKSSEESNKDATASEAVTEVEHEVEADFMGEPDSDAGFLDHDRLRKLYSADQRHLTEDDKEFLLQQYDIAMREVDGIDGKKDSKAFSKKIKELGRDEGQAVIAAITLTKGQAQIGKFSDDQMARYNESKTFYSTK